MPITVEDAIKSDPSVKKSVAGKRVLATGAKRVPKWVWWGGAIGLSLLGYYYYKNDSKGDIQGSNTQPPG